MLDFLLPDTRPALPRPVLSVASAGLCCAVGYNLDAAACAIAASMDHFQHSEFIGRNGEPIIVARLDGENVWGQDRLASWIGHAVRDALRHLPDPQQHAMPMLWLAPSPERHGLQADWYKATFNQAMQEFGLPVHPLSAIIPQGRAGLASALEQIGQWLARHPLDRAMLIGADTYLDAASINHYLASERLLADDNSDGFIPGEAAAAVVIERHQLPQDELDALPNRLWLYGWGKGEEAARMGGDVPNRSQGMTTAMRAALSNARVGMADLDFRLSDQNGEAWFVTDAVNALTRITPQDAAKLPVLTLADRLGEIGAATGPAMLAWLHRMRGQPDSQLYPPGELGLLHQANDNGLRSCVIAGFTPPLVA
ncbi:hypothetical protein ABHF33_01240 [Chitinibacter sp. FCG-7]|uniref:3-oxoacyl-ACP synthase n=1 Tax=Chitinibacter mangrovi TaxID=3153927 RepID=A0AAU7FAI0_9NEIS